MVLTCVEDGQRDSFSQSQSLWGWNRLFGRNGPAFGSFRKKALPPAPCWELCAFCRDRKAGSSGSWLPAAQLCDEGKGGGA